GERAGGVELAVAGLEDLGIAGAREEGLVGQLRLIGLKVEPLDGIPLGLPQVSGHGTPDLELYLVAADPGNDLTLRIVPGAEPGIAIAHRNVAGQGLAAGLRAGKPGPGENQQDDRGGGIDEAKHEDRKSTRLNSSHVKISY